MSVVVIFNKKLITYLIKQKNPCFQFLKYVDLLLLVTVYIHHSPTQLAKRETSAIASVHTVNRGRARID